MARAFQITTAGHPQLRLYLLGSFRIESKNRRIQLPTRKVESLLAYLALHPPAHAREKIAALFWGDSPDEDARRSLRVALTTLRKQFSHELFLTDRETLQINPDYPLWVDALEFQAQAIQFLTEDPPNPSVVNIDLYQGDLLSDFYDDWTLTQREQYRALYLDILLRLTQHLRSQSEYARAIACAQKVVASDPANERAHQHLMFCYIATGDRSVALMQYEECERRLREELEVDPAPETVALYNWIKQTPSERISREALITNLPIPLTSFIGRKKEMKEVKELLSTTRLLTLTGAGGCGKTRLAIQVATDLVDAFKDGVWWVELAALTHEALVPQAVAKALSVHEIPNEPISETLANYLRPRRLLLVFDNCEHLIRACASLVESFLRQCAKLQILATSREALGIAGEVAWRVPTLALPDPQQLSLAQLLMQWEGIRLFVERAGAVKSDFRLTDTNARAVAHICRQLDGIPLALELAAARVKVLSAEQIAARLDDRFRLLTGGSRTALPRHQTLRALIEWSDDLLLRAERIVLRRLSVFRGGWALQAAETICAGEGVEQYQVLDLLTHLVDKSLVLVEQRNGEARYRMLETIRQFAHDKLFESKEAERVQARHLDFFLKLAEEAEAKEDTSEEADWFNRLEAEQDNLRAALRWVLESGKAEAGLRLAGSLWSFWDMRGYVSEGQEWLDRALARSNAASASLSHRAAALRAKVLHAAGFLAYTQHDYVRATRLYEESLTLFRELWDQPRSAWLLSRLGRVAHYRGDTERATALFEESLTIFRAFGNKRGIAYSLNGLGEVARYQGSFERATALCQESLRLYRELGGKAGMAWSLNNLGEVARHQGDTNQAIALLEKGLAFYREVGDRWGIAWSLHNLGKVARDQGDWVRAIALFKDSLASYWDVRDRLRVAQCLVGLAGVAVAQRQAEQAARLWGAAEALREVIGAPVPPVDRAGYDSQVAALRSQLDEARFAAEWAEGRAMTIEEAVEYALQAEL